MEANDQSKLPLKSSTLSEEQLAEAQRNLERALNGLDHEGEAGLQGALDRIYPETGLRVEPFMTDSHAIRFPKGFKIPTRDYDPKIDG